eukprot:2460855-Rhodomonas_salina.1
MIIRRIRAAPRRPGRVTESEPESSGGERTTCLAVLRQRSGLGVVSSVCNFKVESGEAQA